MVSLGMTHTGENVEGNTRFWPKREVNGVGCTVVMGPVPVHIENGREPPVW